MNSATQNNKPQNYLQIVHDRVAGRIRVKVPGLYRNERLCANLESRLAGRDGIRLAHANTLTSNLLIEYATPQDTGEMPQNIVRLLEQELGYSLVRDIESIDRPTRKRVPRKRRRPEAVQYQDQPLQLWHTLSGTRVVDFLQGSEQGLAQEVATQRLAQYGANVLSEQAPRSSWQMFLGQFMSAPVAMLGVSAAVSLATGGVADTVVIVSVVMVNSVIGYVTEKTAEKTINALGQLTPGTAIAVRDGKTQEIPMPEVALGDLLMLSPGSYIPADARLLTSHRLTVDESPLTGESFPIGKNHEYLGEEETALGDRQNMIYMGTTVTGGNGRAIVVATGRHTEIGKIQELVGIAKAPETPMQKQIDDMGRQLALLSSGICVLVFAIGLLRGRPLPQMLMSAISLAVAAVPEGLPAVATTTLALGIREMKRQKVLIRQLPAVENLGSVQVICLDKTGTLTLNQMSVVSLQTLHAGIKVKPQGFYHGNAKVDLYRTDQTLRRMMEVLVLCNEATLAGKETGSPTEKALLQVAIDAGEDVRILRESRSMVKVDYRSEDRPYMVSVHALADGQFFSAVKGSPAEVLELCQKCSIDGQLEVLSEDQRKTILTGNERLGADALRVLGVAYCMTGDAAAYDQRELIWLGLVGMEDVIRPGMEELIDQFHAAGIETIMITGDQSSTAYSVGKRLGLSGAQGKSLEIIDSGHLEKLDPSVLAGLVGQAAIFSRVSPAHKLRIVEALQRSGKVVAMTGDGINDGPALKAANIGVTLGEKGTDVARSVADVILADDDLKTMVTAIREGRAIYDNISKSLHFLLSTNLSEIEVMLVSAVLGGAEILNPMQLLWINLISDIFPALALALDPPEVDVLKRPPRDPNAAIVSRSDYSKLIRESGIITAGTLGVYGYSRLRYGPGQNAGTHAFMSLTFAQLLHAYRCRSEHSSIFDSKNRPANRYLDSAVGLSALMQMLAAVWPPLRRLLRLGPITAVDMIAILAGAGLPLLANEAIKGTNKNIEA